MFTSIAQFVEAWNEESRITREVMTALTDKSLSQEITPGHRTLGRLAWHLVTSIPEMMQHTGIKLEEVKPDSALPKSAGAIAAAYAAVASAMLARLRAEWKDESLGIRDEMYGEKWERRFTLQVLVQHQIHHRGQMSVLMRQAGLRVPSIYGPAKEDWEQYGRPAPEV
ncbi:MAG TPA: DinB family protein [Candidatus Deferrimicrobium sp.]|nr:DinB family protein [Candidatus Deferrimicrobium sp.]